MQKSTQEGQVQKIPGKTYNTSFLTEAQPDISFFSTEIVLQCKTNDIFNFLCLLINLLMRERLTPNLIGDSCLSCHRGFLVSNCATHAASSREPLLAKKDTFMPEFGQIKKLLEKKEKKERKREKGRKSNCATHVVWSREQLLAKKDTFCI